MLNVLVVSALLSLGVNGALDQSLPDTYSQNLKEVLEAKTLLRNRLYEKADYDLFKPQVHYLSMLGVAYYPAKALSSPLNNHTAEQLYEDSIRDNLPDVLHNPADMVKELKKLLSQTLKHLKPLSDLVAKVCDNLSDYECNKLVDKLVKTGPYGDVKQSTLVLKNAYPIASLVLSKDQRLMEVASGLDVIPYLLSNELDNVELVKILAKLVVQVHSR